MSDQSLLSLVGKNFKGFCEKIFTVEDIETRYSRYTQNCMSLEENEIEYVVQVFYDGIFLVATLSFSQSKPVKAS